MNRSIKNFSIIAVIIFVLVTAGCKSTTPDKTKSENSPAATLTASITNAPAATEKPGAESTPPSEKIPGKLVGKINKTNVYLISGSYAANILAADDDYTSKLSKFDFMSKFKSTTPLDIDKRKQIYEKEILTWSASEEKRIKDTISKVNNLLKKKSINLPGDITIITTNGKDEANAAYTRGKSIIFSKDMLKISEGKFVYLFIHELFHVYSRYNIDQRPAIYGIIGYKKCDDLQIPADLKDLTIGNPDAPDNNYYITCTYREKKTNFIPVIYSKKQYNIQTDKPFFSYLNDNMLTVKIEGSKPIPLSVNGKSVIVSKEELPDFYKIIGSNTSYTFHPEETMADNFVFLVRNEKVKDRWILDKLSKIIFTGSN